MHPPRVPAAWLAMACCAALCGPARGAALHTPKPGSPERAAICDAMRAFAFAQIDGPRPEKKVLFKVERMVVSGGYCAFRGFTIFEDGSPAAGTALPDVVYDTILGRANDEWVVVFDLTRTDVPSDDEAAVIRDAMPDDIPEDLLPEFWRDLFRRLPR